MSAVDFSDTTSQSESMGVEAHVHDSTNVLGMEGKDRGERNALGTQLYVSVEGVYDILQRYWCNTATPPPQDERATTSFSTLIQQLLNPQKARKKGFRPCNGKHGTRQIWRVRNRMK